MDARGEIPKQAFTGEQSGLFGKKYLAGPPVSDRLKEGEQIHYLLINRSSGVMIESRDAGESRSVTSGSEYRSIAVVTDQRVFFVIGEEPEDTFIEVPAIEVTGAEHRGSLFSATILIETDTEQYSFSVKKRGSSDPQDAVSYIQHEHVPTTPTKEPEAEADEWDEERDQRTDTEGHEGDSEEPYTGPASRFIHDGESPAEEVVEILEAAAGEIRAVDVAEDHPYEAITALESAREHLKQARGNTGVSDDFVSEELTQIESQHELLARVRTGYTEARRKLVLVDNGLQVPREKLESLESTLADAIEAAEELERSPNKLREYQSQIKSQSGDAENSSGGDGDDQTVGSQKRSDQSPGDQAEKNAPSRSELIADLRRISDRIGKVPEPFHVRRDGEYPGTVFLSEFGTWDSAFTAAFDDAEKTTQNGAMETGTSQTPKQQESDRGSDVDDSDTSPPAIGEAATGTLHEEQSQNEDGQGDGKSSHVNSFVEGFFYNHDDGLISGDVSSEYHSQEAKTGEGLESTSQSTDAATAESTVASSTTGPEPNGQPVATEKDTGTDKESLLEAVERVGDELGKAPTMTEFTDRFEYSQTDIYSYFDSWDDALEAASIEGLSRQALLGDLERLEAELGYPPRHADVEEHGDFSPYDYRREFGSVDAAHKEIGSSFVDHVMETLRQVVAESDGKPAMSDFETASPYSPSVIYKVFDSWDDAIAAVEDDRGPTKAATVVQNELSERYELLRDLHSLCQAVVDIREERLDDSQNDPMDRWLSEIGSFFSEGGANEKAYGAQQRDRNPFAMKKYRAEFGNGERVTDFAHVQTEPPSPSLRALLAQRVENIEEICLPVDEKTGTVFPVLVQSEAEADRALEMLNRLPARPSAAEIDAESEPVKPMDEDGETTNGKGDLLDVSGVTEEISNSLNRAGYETRSDLRAASMETIADVDGLTEQIAMRIKLDVGE
ncbi:homing endonuclease associated repeat-containing protein [Halarchaeum salinum]